MLASGAIGLGTRVWTAAFGSEWKRLGETELAPAPPIAPPPLPSEAPSALLHSPEQPASGSDEFLDSGLTRGLIGKKQDHYLAKWRAILAKAGGDPAQVATTTSWNWPALLLPYAWLLYRKLYVLGGIVLAVQLAYVLLPDSAPRLAAPILLFGTIALAVVFALYGNSWYCDVVRRRWDALCQEPDQAATLASAERNGGVNIIAPAIAVALVIAAAVLPHVFPWGSSSEAVVRDGYMTGYPNTSIGKALAASFDDSNWRSFASDKGASVVEFTGKISASLHANAIEQLMRPIWNTAADSDLAVRYGGYERILPYYETALLHLKANNRIQPILDKNECQQPGKQQNCDLVVSNFKLMRDAVEAWVAEAYWPVGEAVSIQWTINPDGRSFSLANMNSNAWKGKPFSDIFAVLYD